MATEVLMPQLGESVTEGTIARWLVKPGDHVKKYEPLCEVTTDKVNAEVPSTMEGTVTELVAQEGDTLAVGQLICYMDAEGASADGNAASTAAPAGTKENAVETLAERPHQTGVKPAEQAAFADPAPNLSAQAAAPTAQPATVDKKQRYSPAVLRLAQENDIDLSFIQGSGREGRVTRKDVLAFIENGGAVQQNTAGQVQRQETPFRAIPAVSPQRQAEMPLDSYNSRSTMEIVRSNAPVWEEAQPQTALYPGDTEIPVTSVRKTIASRMVQSKHEAPHAWTMVEADLTNLVKFRNSVKNEFKTKEGFNLTFLPFFIKAVVEAIKEFPIMNSTWAGDKIIMRKNINISIAVATDDALYVPVIKNADQKSIYGIARALDELARRTREGKLTMEDMSGGTFTVNNTGSFGSVQSMPIINYPQAAIISIESIVKRPVVIDGMIAIRDMTNFCLSLDHRILDGLVCGRFLQRVKEKMEAYSSNTTIY